MGQTERIRVMLSVKMSSYAYQLSLLVLQVLGNLHVMVLLDVYFLLSLFSFSNGYTGE